MAVSIDGQGDHAEVISDVNAVEQQDEDVEIVQPAAISSSSAVRVSCTKRRLTALLEVPDACCSTALPTGSRPVA